MGNRELIVEILRLWLASLSHANAVYHRNKPCCNPTVLREEIETLLHRARDVR